MAFRFNAEESPPTQEKKLNSSSGARRSPRSMLIIHQGALGDFIVALPSFEILRRSFPRARTVFMGYPRILELVENRFYAEEVLSIDQKGMASFFVREGFLDPQLSGFFKTFDFIVVFGKDGEGNLIRNLKRVSGGEVLHVNTFPRWDERIHLTDHLGKELSRHGFSPLDGLPKIYLSESDREWGKVYWTQKGMTEGERKESIFIHPGSGSRKKVWPSERFLELIKILKKARPSRMVIVLGPAEGPEIRKAFDVERSGTDFLAKGLSLVQLACILEGSRLFVGNDSGISHLAASLGVPTVAIFGPTDPRIWSPRGERVAVVHRKIPCSPCPQERFFQCQHLECLKGIRVEDVVEGIQKLELGSGFKSREGR